MEECRVIDLDIRLDDVLSGSETTATWSGPDVLTISTVLPDHGVVFDLTSTFVGHKGVDTHATHLVLGPHGEDPQIHSEDHPHERLEPRYDPRGCAYEHIQVLMEHLRRLGHDPAIDVPDNAFGELERVESRAQPGSPGATVGPDSRTRGYRARSTTDHSQPPN